MSKYHFLFALSAVLLLTQCKERTTYREIESRSSQPQEVKQNINVPVTSEAADGLNLEVVTALLKTVKTPEDLEKQINAERPRINNLDLNEDGNVDYVKVTEYGNDLIRGFSLTTELAVGDVQELATIEIEKDQHGEVQVQTQGNPQVYGANHYHHHHGPGIGTYLLMSYMFRPHISYISPYGYGRYPRGYGSRRTMSRNNYRSNLRSVNTSGVQSARTQRFQSRATSPNAGKSSNNIKAPLRKPTQSQRAFQKRNPSKTVRSGGFGSKKAKSNAISTRSKPKPKPSRSIRSSSRSRSSFGRGK